MGRSTIESIFGEIEGLDEDTEIATERPAARQGEGAGLFKVLLPADRRALLRRAEPALIDGFLDAVGTSVFYGASQSWKTFGLVDMCDRIAAGEPWAGMPTQAGLCVVFAAESVQSVAARVEATAVARGRGDEHPLVIVEEKPNLFRGRDGDLGDVGRIVRTVRDLEKRFGVPVRLIGIDTFSKATIGCDSNSDRDVALIEARCDSIAQNLRCQVMLIHHTGKSIDGGARGSSVFGQNFPTVLEARREIDSQGRETRTIRNEKQKDRGRAGDILLGMENVEIQIGEDIVPMGVVTAQAPGDPNQASAKPFALRLVEAVAGGDLKSQADLARSLGITPSYLSKLMSGGLDRLVEKRGRAFELTRAGSKMLKESTGLDDLPPDGDGLGDAPFVDPVEAARVDAAADDTFLRLLDRFNGQSRPVSANPRASNYAPRVFARLPGEGEFTEGQLSFAMERLLLSGAAENYKNGRSSSLMASKFYAATASAKV